MSDATSDTEILLRYEPFVAAVRRYVSLIESDFTGKMPRVLLLELNDVMLEVAKLGLLLDYPYLEVDTTDFDSEKYDISIDIEREHRIRLENTIEPLRVAAIANANDYEPHLVAIAMFANNAAEAYLDLARGLRLWNEESITARGEACWHWCFHKWHWHEHLYAALYGNCLIRFTNEESGMDQQAPVYMKKDADV